MSTPKANGASLHGPPSLRTGRLHKKPARKLHSSDTFGTPELCTWTVEPSTCRFQTRRPDFARKLSQRSGARLVAWSVHGGYLRIFEERIEPWRARELVKRFLTPTNGAFLDLKRPQSRRQSRGVSPTAGGHLVNDFSDLREKIDEAKHRLPLPDLMARLGLREHATKEALCMWHDDQRPSFSVFLSKNGKGWQWKCFAGCGHGDEIAFLVKHFGIPRREAIKRYLDMAGFPPSCPPKSHQSPESREYPECSELAVSSVSSNGQALQAELKTLAAHCQCVAPRTSEKKRFQLLRGLIAIQERDGRKLSNAEVTLAIEEWHRLSQSVLDPEETLEHHLLHGLAELRKVKVALGKEVIGQAVEVVLKLPVSDLPVIPGVRAPPESLRRVAALHRELARRSKKKDRTYFLSCRDAAKAHPGLSKSEAAIINNALVQLGVIEIVRPGEQIPDGLASEFRYLLDESENNAEEDGDDLVL